MKKSCLVVLLLGLFTIRLFSQEFSRNLEYKSEGDDVRQIQKMLVELGYGPININGEYDNLTVYAVRDSKRISVLQKKVCLMFLQKLITRL